MKWIIGIVAISILVLAACDSSDPPPEDSFITAAEIIDRNPELLGTFLREDFIETCLVAVSASLHPEEAVDYCEQTFEASDRAQDLVAIPDPSWHVNPDDYCIAFALTDGLGGIYYVGWTDVVPEVTYDGPAVTFTAYNVRLDQGPNLFPWEEDVFAHWIQQVLGSPQAGLAIEDRCGGS
jgi:hypothetical protein